jgi:hypothetical protein
MRCRAGLIVLRPHPATKPQQFEAHELNGVPHNVPGEVVHSATVSSPGLELSVGYSKTRLIDIETTGRGISIR